LRKTENSSEINVFKNQLTKSTSSIGANYEEAQQHIQKRILNIRLELHYEKQEKQIIGCAF
ncbi:MAG TPA: hypothetical protein VII99_12825, partial [Bacteroidia bacterium]